MQEIFMSTDDKRIAVMDNGNNINIVFIAGKRNIQWVHYRNDYHSQLCGIQCNGKIGLAYINVSNELVWDIVGADNRIVLLSDLGNIWNVRNMCLMQINEKNILFYKANNPVNGNCELIYIYPDGERRGRSLVSGSSNIEDYHIFFDGEKNILKYRLQGEAGFKCFVMNTSKLDEIRLEEYVLSSVRSLAEIEERCMLREKDFEKERDALRHEFDKTLRNQADEMEKKYKKQYDELSEFAKQLQEEGKRWRELYYKSVEQ